MLKLYEFDNLESDYVELSMGTMLRPLALSASSLRRQDSRITKKIFVRNDEADVEITGITLKFINIPSSWTAKMIAQESEPLETAFDILPNGNIVSHDDVTTTAYYPVWIEIVIPQGTPPAIFSKMRISVHGTRTVV
jgi:hypothetical protein